MDDDLEVAEVENSQGKTVVFQIIVGLSGAVVLIFGAFIGSTMLDMRDFMARGDRFTQTDGTALARRQDLLEQKFDYERANVLNAVEGLTIETKRLQLQIDRLEGHKPEDYLNDQNSSEMPMPRFFIPYKPSPSSSPV